MTTYGVTATGFAIKPLDVILAEIEAAMVTQFGAGIIQSSQSPLGQINGLMADLAAQMWETAQAVYQSYDPDQAEGIDLDRLARLRVINRGAGETDISFRRAITNVDRARIDLQDLVRAVQSVAGVTYAQAFVNDTTETDDYGLAPGTLSLAVIGGDDDEIAEAMRRYVVPGVVTFGNTRLSHNVDGFCRSFSIIRPVDVPVTLALTVRRRADRLGCPPPSTTAVRDALIADLTAALLNGDDLDLFRVRQTVEGRWAGQVELVAFTGERDEIPGLENAPVLVGFTEIASVTASTVTVTDA